MEPSKSIEMSHKLNKIKKIRFFNIFMHFLCISSRCLYLMCFQHFMAFIKHIGLSENYESHCNIAPVIFHLSALHKASSFIGSHFIFPSHKKHTLSISWMSRG